MASEIRVDKITSLSGVGTISPSPTGVEIAGITTVGILTSTGAIFSGGGLNGSRLNVVGPTPRIYLTDTNNNDDYQVRNENGTFEVRNDTDSVNVFTIEKGPANTATFSSTTKVGTGITLSPDGDVFATGISTIGVIETDKISLGDNERISLGISSDLSIYHDGNDSRIIDSGTGRLIFSSDQVQLNNSGNTEVLAKFIENGAAELFHNNTRRFQTTGAGISVAQPANGFSEFHHSGGNSGIRIAGPAGSSGANLVFANNYDNSTSDEWAIQFQGTTDDLVFVEGGVSGNERIRFQETGGISFNGDTATANALDDYEEGTWTPTVTQGTISVQNANYTKIGRMVYASCRVDTFSDRSSSNAIAIEGLPFTSSVGNNMGSGVFYRVAHTDEGHVGTVVTSHPRIQFLVSSQGGSEAWFYLTYSDLNSSTSQIRLSVWYLTGQ